MSERYELIAAEKAEFEVTMMCELLDVSRSGFYEWYGRAPSAAQRRRAELTEMIRFVFASSGRTYGYRRVHAELVRSGVAVDDELVRRLMVAAGLVPVQVKRRRGLTVADKAAGPIPDLVGRDFTAAAPGAKMVGDITQIDTGEGPLYLASVIDCYSKSVLGGRSMSAIRPVWCVPRSTWRYSVCHCRRMPCSTRTVAASTRPTTSLSR